MQEPKKLWFKAKRYGWGWTPVTWQGWLVTAAYVVLVVRVAVEVDARSHSASDTLLGLAPRLVIATVALILICYARGEKPRWRWGKD